MKILMISDSGKEIELEPILNGDKITHPTYRLQLLMGEFPIASVGLSVTDLKN